MNVAAHTQSDPTTAAHDPLHEARRSLQATLEALDKRMADIRIEMGSIERQRIAVKQSLAAIGGATSAVRQTQQGTERSLRDLIVEVLTAHGKPMGRHAITDEIRAKYLPNVVVENVRTTLNRNMRSKENPNGRFATQGNGRTRTYSLA